MKSKKLTPGEQQIADRYKYLPDIKELERSAKEVEPTLRIDEKDSIFTYNSPNGNSSSAHFRLGTSEFSILVHLIEHRSPVDTSTLIDILKGTRSDAEGADPKQRVRDKIKAIGNKLGKDLIKRNQQGYFIDCKIIPEHPRFDS